MSSTTSNRQTKPYSQILCLILFVVASSASFSGFYQRWHFQESGPWLNNSRATFEDMVDGTASRPFVYRQLLPAIANAVDTIAPNSWRMALYSQACKPGTPNSMICASETARNRIYFFRYVIVYVTTYCSALLAVYGMYLVCTSLEVPRAAAAFASAMLIMLIPYFQTNAGYFYDYSELALMSLAVWSAIRFDWWLLIPITIAGAWNKESYLFFIVSLYPILRSKYPRAGALLRISSLCLICATIYYSFRLHFARNAGGPTEFNLPLHFQFLMHPLRLIASTEEIYGVRVPSPYTIGPIALLIWCIRRNWSRLPQAIRQHAAIAAIINLPLYFLFCFPGELRNLSMLYVSLLVLIASSINEWIVSSYTGQLPVSSTQ